MTEASDPKAAPSRKRHPMYLSTRPKSWGAVIQTHVAEGAKEVPVTLTVLVKRNRLVGLKGPEQVLEAVYRLPALDLGLRDCMNAEDPSCPWWHDAFHS